MNRFYVLAAAIIALFSSCGSKTVAFEGGKASENVQLFELLSPENTGITFNNNVIENEDYNHVLQDVIFNGGGVAVLDVNNDGLQDLYFAGNQVSDQLYLNEGNMKFSDISNSSGISNLTWSNAVAVADVNNDGLDDIYVGKYIRTQPEDRINELYINNGDNTFTESAAAYGVADNGFCTAANFFDYNNDGLLDLYVGNQPFVSREIKYSGVEATVDRTKYTDRLYKNNGDGTFTDVTAEANITNYNYTLSATASDMNNDGWMDIYIASDYEEPDIYYQNNGDGTFTDMTNLALRHMSNFSMGVDIADFNNDGFVDIYVADMVAADNYRLKANMSGMNPERFWELANSGFHYQYMFNMLQLNNGNGFFSEIGHLAGLSNTDWSWATLFADYDNDGDKDLMVTNGLVKEVKNKDYINRRAVIMDSLYASAVAEGRTDPRIPSVMIAEMAPSVKLSNYIFSNQGDLTFSDQVESWGFEKETWSNGAVYSDLDNDGDLDLVVSNMNDVADVYENQASDLQLNNYLQIELEGDQGNNRKSVGAKVKAYTGETVQMLEMSPTRGYLSCNEALLHFGLGSHQMVDKIEVVWPDGRGLVLTDVPVNQRLILKQADATKGAVPPEAEPEPMFANLDGKVGINLKYEENEFNDYDREILLPHKMSTLGPCSAKGDINGDGLDDLFIGGAAGKSGSIFLQLAEGQFVQGQGGPWLVDVQSEDVNAVFFDADADGDEDLYVVSGGNEYPIGDRKYQDRLYLNNGQGSFTKANVLPSMPTSGGVAAPGDMDGDGDLDLFVGGRQVPGKYGFAARSYLLRNDGGKFVEVTTEVAPELYEPGMVTDAKWFDFDGDDDEDLVVVGEWMPIGFYQNQGASLRSVTEEIGMQKTNGWWNRIEIADMDNDGDMDIIGGNLGYNIKFKASEEEPFRLLTKDFDGNGTHDVYLAYYDRDGVCYPVRGRQCSSQQMPYIKKEFGTYHEFASATVEEVLGDRVEGARELEVQEFASSYIENLGGGAFEHRPLPNEAQISPVFGIVCHDFNGDGIKDLLVAGNYYEREVETARSDAGTGQVLIHDGKGNFTPLHPSETGLLAIGDVRSLELLSRGEEDPLLIIANNNNFVQCYGLDRTNM